MTHTADTKRKIGAASKARNSAAVALAARWANRATVCSVAGCGGVHEAKGLCNMHYLRLRNNRDIGAPDRIHDGEGAINSYGYFIVHGKGQHVHVAEKAIGKRLPEGAIVHHVNHDTLDNANSNLVVCQNRAYHNLLHARERALDACGNANWLMCPFCGKYDDPVNLYVYPNRRAGKHRDCFNAYRKKWECSQHA